MNQRARSISMWVLGAAAMASLIAGAASCRWPVHWRVRNGVVLSVRDGRFRLFAWDTNQYRISYLPGLSVEEQECYVEWLPYVHWGQAPARVAAPGLGEYVVAVPAWIVSGALVTGALWLRRCKPAGLCRRCGYDLRGLESRSCPECGTAPK